MPYVLHACGCWVIAAIPTLSTIAHTGCSVSGTTLQGCDPAGTGTLTITGNYFYGAGVTVNYGCQGALTFDATFDQITCQLAAGAGGTCTTSNIAVTTNGGTSTATGRLVCWGRSLVSVLT